MRSDPLKGLTARQRREHEQKCARHFGTYDPDEHTGWLAEAMRGGAVIVAERVDLQHPAKPVTPLRAACRDCGADLQYRDADNPTKVEMICLACAYRRASLDD